MPFLCVCLCACVCACVCLCAWLACVCACGWQRQREEVGGGSSWNGKLVHGVFLLDAHARERESVCVAAATVLKKRESLFACVRGRVYRGACVSDLPWWRVERPVDLFRLCGSLL